MRARCESAAAICNKLEGGSMPSILRDDIAAYLSTLAKLIIDLGFCTADYLASMGRNSPTIESLIQS